MTDDAERLERLAMAAADAAMQNAWLTWAVEEVDALRSRGLDSEAVARAFHDAVETKRARGEIQRRYQATLRRLLDPNAPVLH